MNVGGGGAGRETVEWVNALLAAFWAMLQPLVSRCEDEKLLFWMV